MPTLYIAKPASRWERAPPLSSGRPRAPPRWRSSLSSSGEPEPGPATETKASIASSESSRIVPPSPIPGHRVLGVHVDPAEPRGGHPGEGVHDRLADLAQRRDRRFALGLAADAGGVDRQQRPAADRLRHVGDRRRGDEADDRGDLVGDAGGPVAVGADRVGADLGREDERAGVDLVDRQQVEVQGGDDGVAAPAAAQRPEEVGVVARRRPVRGSPVGRDQLDRRDAVAGEAVAAAEPAQPAAERVADHADVGGGARHRAEPVLSGGLAQLEHEHAGLDPRRLRIGVDLDAAHALGLEQDRAVERRQRRGAVAGALGGDLEAVLGGEADGGGDVVGALGEDDAVRPLVGDEVPGGSRLVPVGVVGGGDTAGDRQPGEVGHLGLLEAVVERCIQRQTVHGIACPDQNLAHHIGGEEAVRGDSRGRRRGGRRGPPGRRSRRGSRR